MKEFAKTGADVAFTFNHTLPDDLLKELGYSSIRSQWVSEDTARLVMAADSKGELRPVWECRISMQVIADGEVIQEHFQGPTGVFFSAEDGSPM